MSKGSAPRLFSVPLDDYGDRFDAIFRKDQGKQESISEGSEHGALIAHGMQSVHGYPQAHGEAHGPGQVQQDARQGVPTDARG